MAAVAPVPYQFCQKQIVRLLDYPFDGVGFPIPITKLVPDGSGTIIPVARNDSTVNSAGVGSLFFFATSFELGPDEFSAPGADGDF